MRKITKTLLGTILAMSMTIAPISVYAEVEGPDTLPLPGGFPIGTTEEEREKMIFDQCPEGYYPWGMFGYNAITGESKTIYYYYEKIKDKVEDDIPSNPLLAPIEAYTPGDLDYDGKVTLKDAKRNLSLAMGIEEEVSTKEFMAADMDQDNRITLQDTSQNLKAALDIPTKTEEATETFGEGTISVVGSNYIGIIEDNIPDNEIRDNNGYDLSIGLKKATIIKDGIEVSMDELTIGSRIKYTCKCIQESYPARAIDCTKIIIQ